MFPTDFDDFLILENLFSIYFSTKK
jgi:hypothetical protein